MHTITSAIPAGCTGGVPPVLSQACTSPMPQPPACTDYTYSAWGACLNGMQTRTVMNSLPAGCSVVNPVLSQSCIPATQETYPPTTTPTHTMLTIIKTEIQSNLPLPGSPRTRIFGIKLIPNADGTGDVVFNGANGNHLDVAVTGDAANLSPFICVLTDGTTVYSVTSASFGTRSFNFSDNVLAVSPVTSKTLFVDCDTTHFTTSGDHIQAALTRTFDFISWGDAVTNNYTGQGVYVIPNSLVGSTFSTP